MLFKGNPGYFTISLDFELLWGVFESKNTSTYGANLDGTPEAVEKLLTLFEKYHVHATWAVVGMLYLENEQSLKNTQPNLLPNYSNKQLNPYHFINSNSDTPNSYLYAPELIHKISTFGGQEISTHTFSHYFCLEDGQTIEQFKADLETARAVASRSNHDIRTIVFPRNQVNVAYLEAAAEQGIVAYRGTELHWAYEATSATKHNSKLKKAIRLIDSYVNITGHHIHSTQKPNNDDMPTELKASRFLRPYTSKLRYLDKLRLKRITDSMDKAAASGKVYHLWWHPHNFGINQDENFQFLESILKHFAKLNNEGRLLPATMSELADLHSK